MRCVAWGRRISRLSLPRQALDAVTSALPALPLWSQSFLSALNDSENDASPPAAIQSALFSLALALATLRLPPLPLSPLDPATRAFLQSMHICTLMATCLPSTFTSTSTNRCEDSVLAVGGASPAVEKESVARSNQGGKETLQARGSIGAPGSATPEARTLVPNSGSGSGSGSGSDEFRPVEMAGARSLY